ncbi:uncharacterized protein K452DRAFT_303772 [Aplosporella prunicola CBS 121167]|uniref:Uncharacterized protein n=1 Tax=Aplosporella prunicola CBS 121167 TaxID=1176127 RepID=A0A6A6AV95_9PEZI|nr:uncharacterized protein K452DRAFT_303772 [Aplosporella prunicola CBS 121167]KAF2135128.1 hypothetical protein K452DRAFT_303772 [Aplosporella prunicola CBS 121167]
MANTDVHMSDYSTMDGLIETLTKGSPTQKKEALITQLQALEEAYPEGEGQDVAPSAENQPTVLDYQKAYKEKDELAQAKNRLQLGNDILEADNIQYESEKFKLEEQRDELLEENQELKEERDHLAKELAEEKKAFTRQEKRKLVEEKAQLGKEKDDLKAAKDRVEGLFAEHRQMAGNLPRPEMSDFLPPAP